MRICFSADTPDRLSPGKSWKAEIGKKKLAKKRKKEKERNWWVGRLEKRIYLSPSAC